MKKNSVIYIAGHNGMVGSSIFRLLSSSGYSRLITRNSKELDLRDQSYVNKFFEEFKPEYVFLAAAKVGGILADKTYPAEFIYDNLMIEANVIHASFKYKVKKLLFFGSSCIYPKYAEQPLKEESLLSGYLEPSNQSYAISKIAGIQMCSDYRKQYGVNFISLMPPNLYGFGDNFNPKTSHVLPALIDRIHKAKINKEKHVDVWGSGNPFREFLYVDDLAEASLYMMKHYSGNEHINIGSGQECSIKDLAKIISKVVGYDGKIRFDKSKPDGTPRKILNIEKASSLGWTATTSLEQGLIKTYSWYTANIKNLRL